MAEWSEHTAAMCSRVWSTQWPRSLARERPPTKELFVIILVHDEQGVNPGQVRGFDGVLYKL